MPFEKQQYPRAYDGDDSPRNRPVLCFLEQVTGTTRHTVLQCFLFVFVCIWYTLLIGSIDVLTSKIYLSFFFWLCFFFCARKRKNATAAAHGVRLRLPRSVKSIPGVLLILPGLHGNDTHGWDGDDRNGLMANPRGWRACLPRATRLPLPDRRYRYRYRYCIIYLFCLTIKSNQIKSAPSPSSDLERSPRVQCEF